MNIATHTLSLRHVLWFDAAACAVMGTTLTVASTAGAELTAIPQPVLFWAGLSLLPIALFMAVAGLRPHSISVGLVIVGNGAWVAASLALVSGFIAPNALGVLFIVAQAVVVALLAWLEYAALTQVKAWRARESGGRALATSPGN